jgi:G3E family GTPase
MPTKRTPDAIPVTILTGFLGSGKTTVLNQVLRAGHGKRIAVIENEFGEVGIDNELVFCAKDELFNMEAGCVCCTIRPDLIRILGDLVQRPDRFDHIVIETTGLADPAPVAQTFFVDEDIKAKAFLDAVVTVVDAKHVLRHLDESRACLDQIALADIVLLNKCDLVAPKELEAVEARIRAINGLARIHRTTGGQVAHADFLGQGGFNLDRALEGKPAFLQDEYPFEHAARYTLARGSHALHVAAGNEGSMALVLVSDGKPMRDLERDASALLMRAAEGTLDEAGDGGRLAAGVPGVLTVAQDQATRVHLDVAHAGDHVLFTQHGPDGFGFTFMDPDGNEHLPREVVDYMAGHAHDNAIASVSLTSRGALDAGRLSAWLTGLLKEQGADIYRLKGILDLGVPERHVVHAVHMRLDTRADRPWRPGEARGSQLVLIGRNLDKKALQRAFRKCVARPGGRPKPLPLALRAP